MPRIYTSENEPLDFCYECFPPEDEADAEYKGKGEGPDKRGDCYGYDADHPPYAGTGYTCDGGCGKELGDDDD